MSTALAPDLSRMKLPNPQHPITIEPNPNRVTVRVGGRTIADTIDSLILREASYPPVLYIRRDDVDMSLLERSTHTTHCAFKGECNYFSIPAGGEKAVNAVWTYEAAYPAMAEIEGRLAFYPDRVDSIVEIPAA